MVTEPLLYLLCGDRSTAAIDLANSQLYLAVKVQKIANYRQIKINYLVFGNFGWFAKGDRKKQGPDN